MINAPPLKGQRVLLRGFELEREQPAKALLAEHGFQIVSSIALADALVVGSGLVTQASEAAKKSKIAVFQWDELRARLGTKLTPRAHAPMPCRSAVEVGTDHVRILDQTLPRTGARSPLVPPAEHFQHLCLDGCFMRNARAVAMGIRNRLPVALEGDTAASKTTAIHWLAHLLGHPVVRLNLHGQTDSGELLGRYVPRDSEDRADDPATRRALAGSRLELSRGESRSWNKHEEGIPVGRGRGSAWHFQEGQIPQAMRQGWWVVLDEVNLAEPQVLERLNPIIEQPSSLILTEGSGTIFGAGGIPISPGFHMFASMNPAEYAGRSVLSPAFRDRWLIWHQAESPGEAELLAMLRFLVSGEHPEFAFNGVCYQAPDGRPVYPALAGCGKILELLPRLATFHSSLCEATRSGGISASLGRLRRERYVFTRRTLLTCLQLLSRARTEDPVEAPEAQLRKIIEIIYIGRMRDGSDRSAAISMLRASGLVEG